MRKTLITGATGNIGKEVIYNISKVKNEYETILAVRNIEKAKTKVIDKSQFSFRRFDFENGETFKKAFKNIDTLFLLRPPNLDNIDKIFKPLLVSAKENKIKNIIFLSVQGAEKSSLIPHHKIEKLITKMNFNYIFVRPSYFMQNLTTTLLLDIKSENKICLPSGNAKFNWIDIRDIGEITAILLSSFKTFKNTSIEITGSENKNFYEVSKQISNILGRSIIYESMNPISFYFKKVKEGMHSGFATIMTILHFLPRFQNEPKISNSFKQITGNSPTLLEDFIEREKKLFI